jgi:hypothetical protein
MDEIDILRTLGRDVPGADARARAAARTALLAHADAAAKGARWTAAGRSWGRRGFRITAAVAALATLALIGSGLLPLGRGPDPAAAAALNRAAEAAAAQPVGSTLGYRHTKSTGAHLMGVGGGPDRPNGVWALVPVEREIWIKADGSGRLVESRGEPIWFGPADKAAWTASGLELPGQSHSDARFGPAPSGVAPGTPQAWPGSLYFEDVEALPTDVAALRRVIDERAAADGGSTDYERFTIVGDLLRETVGTPQLRAAAYRVAAGLSGVDLIGSVTDRAGRIGTAVAMTIDGSSRGLERRTLIFDPRTAVLLAEEDVLLDKVDWLDADPPLVIGYTTYLVSDIVPTIP